MSRHSNATQKLLLPQSIQKWYGTKPFALKHNDIRVRMWLLWTPCLRLALRLWANKEKVFYIYTQYTSHIYNAFYMRKKWFSLIEHKHIEPEHKPHLFNFTKNVLYVFMVIMGYCVFKARIGLYFPAYCVVLCVCTCVILW